MFWRCVSCEGRLFTLAVLRKQLEASYVNRLWRSARDSAPAASVPCPMCRNAMREVSTASAENVQGAIHLDVCTACHTVWFDVHEIESAREAAPLVLDERELPARAREILAIARVEERRRDYEREELLLGAPPTDFWTAVVTLFGVPVEVDRGPLSRTPWVTISAIAGMAAASLLAWYAFPDWISEWGFLPIDPLRWGGATLLTSFFLHSDFFHLLGNALFLAAFGVRIEDRFGHAGIVCLLVVATIAGSFFHFAGDPRATIVCTGASGGVSGVITLYALLFPKAILVAVLRIGLYFRWIRFRAVWGFAFWLFWQAVLIFKQVAGEGNVSGLAHAGGIAVGVLAWARVRWTERIAAESRPSESGYTRR